MEDNSGNDDTGRDVPAERPTEDLTDKAPANETPGPADAEVRKGHLTLLRSPKRPTGQPSKRDKGMVDEALRELQSSQMEFLDSLPEGDRLESFCLCMVSASGARVFESYSTDWADEDALLATVTKAQVQLAVDMIEDDEEDGGPDDDGGEPHPKPEVGT